MSKISNSVLALAFVASLLPINVATASDLSPEQLADARSRVQAAATLAAIGKAENDGDLLVAAAKLLAKAGGPVAIPGEPLKDGKPTAYSLKGLLDQAKAAGADTGSAEKAAMSMPSPTAASCYWYYSRNGFSANYQWPFYTVISNS
jgi:hypothetical protein